MKKEYQWVILTKDLETLKIYMRLREDGFDVIRSFNLGDTEVVELVKED